MDAPSPLSLTDRIAADLRDAILRGRYQAGDRLPSERELAERFETHRGAVREALKKLEQLGIAEIKPGGARAVSIEEASLDVVAHLIDLDETPDPEIVDQMLEAFSGLFSLAARLAAERANPSQRARAREIIEALMREDLAIGEDYTLMNELGDLFVESSGNLVMGLMRRGLKTQYFDRIDQHEWLVRPPGGERVPLLREIQSAIDKRDGTAASEAIYALTQALRRNAVAILEARREAEAAPSAHVPRAQGTAS